MLFDKMGRRAVPRARSECPGCSGVLVAKCGSVITWHWAHLATECDPWSEPESEWHRQMKLWFAEVHGASIEVVMGPHRADVVLPNGTVVELQAHYLSAPEIAAREAFYGQRLVWVYRCSWADRLHRGSRGFWWKHGAISMARHQRPVYWYMGDRIQRVRVGVVTNRGPLGESHTRRVLGRFIGEPTRVAI